MLRFSSRENSSFTDSRKISNSAAPGSSCLLSQAKRNSEVAKGLAQLGLESGIPVTYGMITADNLEQAINRSGVKAGNKGVDAALAAIEMVNLSRAIKNA